MHFVTWRIHLAAIAMAMVLVLGVRVQDQPLPALARWTAMHDEGNYTKYFPGLNRIERHEIFSPANSPLRKIVFLGASAVHSVGCDYTWFQPAQAIREPDNVHYSCSVAEQFNDELVRRGIKGWKAFNLGKAGGRLVPMVYVYARLLPLKPDVVVYGDNFPYYMETNAGADNLQGEDYEFLGRVFSVTQQTRSIWEGFEATLREHGLYTGFARSPRNVGKSFMRLQPDDSLSGVLAGLLTKPRNQFTELDHPLPLRYARYRRWETDEPRLPKFYNPDPGFSYLQGVRLMGEMQRQHGGKMFMYYSPQFDHRGDTVYNTGLEKTFGGYLDANKIAHTSLVELPLVPVIDTYDGHHQTVDGNRKIASALLDRMIEQGLLE